MTHKTLKTTRSQRRPQAQTLHMRQPRLLESGGIASLVCISTACAGTAFQESGGKMLPTLKAFLRKLHGFADARQTAAQLTQHRAG